MSAKNSILVSKHATFLKAENGDETRYYPYTPTHRIKAYSFDKGSDPVKVQGFAVYDTAISGSYAVALYATLAEAEAHAPTVPTKDELFHEVAEHTPEPEPEENEKAPDPEPEDELPWKRSKKRK